MANQVADFERDNSEYFSITNAAQTGLGFTGDFSVAFWIKRESIGTFQGIITKRTTNNTDFYHVYFDDSDKLVIGYEDSNLVTQIETSAAISDTDVWIHLAVTVDVSAASATIYKGAVSQATSTAASNATSIGTNTDPFTIGQLSGGNYLDSRLAYVRAWDTILTQSEIEAEKDSRTAVKTTNLQGDWSLNGDATDASSNGNDLTNNNTVTFVSGDDPIQDAVFKPKATWFM